jgi:hypothetical protein
MPTAQGAAPTEPVYGPAHLVSSAQKGFMNKGQHSDSSFLSMVEGKARQSHQNLIRALGPCDVMVFGELDASNNQWSSMQQNAGQLFATSSMNKTCNCFSVHAAPNAIQMPVQEGTGWVAIKSGNVTAVFVHVPNAIAKNESQVADFYKEINNKLLHAGMGQIDLIMGDTNQPRNGFTQQAVSKAVGNIFADAHPGSSIQPFDSHERSFGGTNSTGSIKYDVAVYNTATVRVEQMIYLSQCTPVRNEQGHFAAAVTDHMGIGVKVVK